MSRVHEALRRAEQFPVRQPQEAPVERTPPAGRNASAGAFERSVAVAGGISPSLLEEVQEIPYSAAAEAHLINLQSHESPAEEFRTLRTRLNHLQSLQPLHNIVVTSPSPAEGKTFTAMNLALAQAQLAENMVFLADLDLRRPAIHLLLQTDRSPGASDYLLGHVPLSAAIRRISGTNLFVMPAGSHVKNPLELLNLRQAKALFEDIPSIFRWAIFDTPPLLFSADANLLSTMADGTVLVVRIGATSYDSVVRAMQSLCENNVLGIVANGARASELYSKYTYYYSKPE